MSPDVKQHEFKSNMFIKQAFASGIARISRNESLREKLDGRGDGTERRSAGASQ
jgi:hypothetical protein